MNEPRWSRDSLGLLDEGPFEKCPFCGSENLGFYEYVYAQKFAAVCRACGAQGPQRSASRNARSAWNKRAG